MSLKIPCRVYRSAVRAETYLYVDARLGLDAVPEELLKHFGCAEHALSLVLELGRRLARADVVQVIEAIRDRGYYLQMPPTPGQEVEALLTRQIESGGLDADAQ